MDFSDVHAVIESAKARGDASLSRFIRRRLPDASDDEIREATEVCIEIIETVPIFFARAAQEAERRGLDSVVHPLLAHAVTYFVRPVDLIPEMTHGLAGLLDDTYLVIRMLQNLEKGPEPFLDWDLDHPAMFIRGLVGPQVGRRLEQLSIEAMIDVSTNLSVLWSDAAERA